MPMKRCMWPCLKIEIVPAMTRPEHAIEVPDPAFMLSSSHPPPPTYLTIMDFPIIRRERQSVRERPSTNGTNTPNGEIDRRPHTQDKDLPGGANWVVQKFGGTSVGKFAVKIAEDIVL